MDILSELSAHGYAQLQDIESIQHALLATEELGPLLPLNGSVVQELVPKKQNAVRSNSFSSRHGLGVFPLHTDTAFWGEPARFVVLFSHVDSRSATRVLSLQDTNDLMARARRSNPIFLRKTTNGITYSRPWENKEIGVLYDPCYMLPVNQAGREFQDDTLGAGESSQKLNWSGATALVLDNWRVMHGRDSCNDDNRVLYRFYRGMIR